MRFNTSVAVKETRRAKLDGFLGLDVSNPATEVNKSRATAMKNFINVNGINRKRHGFKQMWSCEHLATDYPSNTAQLCGVVVANGGLPVGIDFSGENYYILKEEPVKRSLPSGCTSPTRIQAFNQNSSTAYVIGCGKYLRVEWDGYIHAVKDNVNGKKPTTTINIKHTASTDDIKRVSLDSVNLLNDTRINMLFGTSSGTPENPVVYQLDATNIKDDVTITKIYITLASGTIALVYIGKDDDGNALYKKPNETTTFALFDFTNGEVKFYGSTEPVGTDDNIKVIFQKAVDSSAVDKATCGIMYGIGGKSDRLFLARGNKICYSEANDMTYFPADNYITLGSSNVEILGMAILPNGCLGVIKAENDSEPCLYVINGSYESYTDSDGIERLMSKFSIIGSYAVKGAKPMFYNAMVNFNGDIVYVTKDGIYGLNLSSNVAMQEWYSKERSAPIRELVKNKDIIAIFVYDNKLYVSVDDSGVKYVYIADSRYKFKDKTTQTGSFNYEWWAWQFDEPIYQFYEYDSNLYAVSAFGKVFIYDKDYVDEFWARIPKASLSKNITNNYIAYNNAFTVNEGDKLRATGGFYFKVVDSSDILSVEDGYIYVKDSAMFDSKCNQLINNDDEVYVDELGVTHSENDTFSGFTFTQSANYKIIEVDTELYRFKLKKCIYDPSYVESIATPTDTNFRLIRRVKYVAYCAYGNFITKLGEPFIATNVANNTFQLTDTNGNILTIVNYNNTASDISYMDIVKQNNVECEWITPVFDFGVCDYSKTLESIAISIDKSYNSDIKFGYATAGIDTQARYTVKGLDTLNFADFDLARFSFQKEFYNAYVKRVKHNFNYLLLRVKSGGDKDCAINSIIVSYKINNKIKGVF